MKQKIIAQIADDKKVKNKTIFIEFISKRFPNEPDEIKSYVEQWADRFNSNHPEVFMDSTSKSIYKKITGDTNEQI